MVVVFEDDVTEKTASTRATMTRSPMQPAYIAAPLNDMDPTLNTFFDTNDAVGVDDDDDDDEEEEEEILKSESGEK